MSYNLLEGKKGIIFGALDNKSIAWKVAEKAFEEGASITLSNTATALRFGQIDELAKNVMLRLLLPTLLILMTFNMFLNDR